jgi:predicted nucleic-acid-binding protein
LRHPSHTPGWTVGERQSAKANEILERRLTEKNPGFVSVIAIVETVWVLDRAYGFTAQEIATAVERLLQIEVLVVENEQESTLPWLHQSRDAAPLRMR